ncbi:transmembrane protein, putative [Medicago truncatula]|uniref:Transmembrane protein, putative n=1 Tax=Medicago truncatula TaxID=3880 RepID=G7KHW6_MEDTR|nr:transmembrane protein, putative [Medicago truncatula]
MYFDEVSLCNSVSTLFSNFMIPASAFFFILYPFFPSISLQWLIATTLISCILPIIPALSWCRINNKYSLRIVLLFVICFFSYFYIEKFVGVSVIAGDMGLMAIRCRTLVFEARVVVVVMLFAKYIVLGSTPA